MSSEIIHATILEDIDPLELLAYEGNARQHPPEQIADIRKSIEAFGWTRPALIDENGMILAGHGAVSSAVGILPTVQCKRISGLSPEKKAALVLADNRLALGSNWNEDILRAEIELLKEADFDLSLTGFTFEEIERLLAELPEVEPEEPKEKEKPAAFLKFGKRKVPINADEIEDLGARLDAHVDQNGSESGFVAQILMALARQDSQYTRKDEFDL